MFPTEVKITIGNLQTSFKLCAPGDGRWAEYWDGLGRAVQEAYLRDIEKVGKESKSPVTGDERG